MALEVAQKYLHSDPSLDEMPVSFRWDDVEGYDFTGPVKDQGGCGSCYAIATNSMLESRIKIWFGKEKHLST